MDSKKKRLNTILNIIITICFCIYPASIIFYYLDMKSHPEIYAMDSAPWHTRTIPWYLLFLVSVSVCVYFKSKYGKRNGF